MAPTSTPRLAVRLSDLNAAALLLINGFTFLRADSTPDPRRFEFVLEGDQAKAETLLAIFWSGRATVRLEEFVAAQRKLKNVVHRGQASKLDGS